MKKSIYITTGLLMLASITATAQSNITKYGVSALANNTTGDNNTAIGAAALYKNTTGSFNNAHGKDALFNCTSGSRNNAIGQTALFNNITGNDNIANGYYALFSNVSGNSNVANGSFALYFNTIGGSNTANGYQALYNNTTGAQNTAHGHQSLYFNTEGTTNSANGRNALYKNTTGDFNTASGARALLLNTTGNNNTAIGYDAQVPDGTASNQVRIGNTNSSVYEVQVPWSTGSDRRWKEEIRVLPYGLDVVMQLKPVDYIRKNNNAKTREIGFIAQDIEALLKKVGYNDHGILTKNDKGFLSVRYNDFIPMLTKAIQEQQTIIEQKTAEFDQLRSEMEELKSALEAYGLNVQSTKAQLEGEPNKKIILNQNVPNPFKEKTTIKYFIPNEVQNGQIVIFDNTGKLIKEVKLENGFGNLDVYASNLSDGIYTYNIMADGKVIDSKKMILTK
ncbi:MAG: tail fiber domain-containing protein [Flavobacteriales bacterium]|nr:tail fiber domain-containing protein [Flavobacteriales bacterium]